MKHARYEIIAFVLLCSFAASFLIEQTDFNVIGYSIIDAWSIIDSWATQGTASLSMTLIAGQNNVQVSDSGTLTFTDPEIRKTIPQATNLASKCAANITFYGSSFPSGFDREPNATEAGSLKIEYFDMAYNCTLGSPCTLHFNISESAMNGIHSVNISLFTYNTTHDVWENLSTTVISTNDPLEFTAIIHHFSDFLIAQRPGNGIGSSPSPSPPSPSPGGSGGGGGGGGGSSSGGESGGASGGAAGGASTSPSFSIAPSQITATLQEDEVYTASLGILNTGDNPLSYSIDVKGKISEILDVSDASGTIAPGDEKIIEVTIFAQTERSKLITGSIEIIAGGLLRTIPVVVAVKQQDALFDIGIHVDKNIRAKSGTLIPASLYLQNIGLRGVPTDVIVDVYLGDIDGKRIAPLWKETIAVSTLINLNKEFLIPKQISGGSYILIAHGVYETSQGPLDIEAFDSIQIESDSVQEQPASSGFIRKAINDVLYALAILVGALLLLGIWRSSVKFIKRKRIIYKNPKRSLKSPAENKAKKVKKVRDDYWDEMQHAIK